MLLKASVTLITKGSHQRVSQPKKNLLLYVLSKSLYCGCHLQNTAKGKLLHLVPAFACA